MGSAVPPNSHGGYFPPNYQGGPLLAQMAKAPALTGLSKSMIYRLMQAGQIRGVNIGKSSFVDMASVSAYIASLQSNSIRGAV